MSRFSQQLALGRLKSLIDILQLMSSTRDENDLQVKSLNKLKWLLDFSICHKLSLSLEDHQCQALNLFGDAVNPPSELLFFERLAGEASDQAVIDLSDIPGQGLYLQYCHNYCNQLFCVRDASSPKLRQYLIFGTVKEEGFSKTKKFCSSSLPITFYSICAIFAKCIWQMRPIRQRVNFWPI